MTADIRSSIERFAAVLAELASPYASRAQVLAAVGVSERDWTSVAQSWRTRLASSPELMARMRDAYAAARARHASPPGAASHEAAAHDARFLSREAQPFRAEAAGVPLSAEAPAPPTPIAVTPEIPHNIAFGFTSYRPEADEQLDMTAPPVSRHQPVLPFAPGDPAEVLARLDAEAASRAPIDARDEPTDPTEQTMELRADIASVTLPFVRIERRALEQPPAAAPGEDDDTALAVPIVRSPRPAPSLPTEELSPLVFPGHRLQTSSSPASSPVPQRRLMRFDPQTGQPLAEPRWVDVPPGDPSSSPKK